MDRFSDHFKGMPFSAVPTLARRFLLSKASDRFLSFIAWVSIVGIALGVLALTVVTSVINGFEGELTRVITGMNGDVFLYSRADPISNPDEVEAKIKRVVPESSAITRSFVMTLMASGPSGVAGALLEGFDGGTLGAVTDVPSRVISGRLPTQDGEVALGSALAERLGAKEGGEIRIIVPDVELADDDAHPADHAATAPKVVKVKMVGVVKMGMYDYDSKSVFATLSFVQKFMDQAGKVTSFNIRLPDGVDSRKVSERLSDNFGFPFRAKDWAQLNQNLFYAIKLEKVVIAIILTAIVIVAAFNVVSTLMMMIHDKTKEIAILKAMGFRRSQSFGLFCLIGVGMGVVGTAVGVVGGLGVNWMIRKTHLIDLPADVYYIGFLPVVVRWSEVGVLALLALLITFAATIYPAWSVAARSPLEGLRYE